MRIIPAIDIISGKCVRLTKGDYNTKIVYNEDPLEVAKEFEDNGIKYLHLVDLDGAKSSKIINYKVLYQIATKTKLKIDFGGGIKSDADIEIAFENGACQITGGSIAVSNETLFLEWVEKYGDKVILGADCKDRKIATHGWLTSSELDIIDFISHFKERGIKEVICTDIAKDGMLEGASEELYSEILSKCSISLIASGGIATMADVELMAKIGCQGVIVGKAIYENRISIKDLGRLEL